MQMPTDSSYRYERKFHTSSLFREDVVNIIKLHPANFGLAYPDRFVNNIYLDTAEFDCFNDNVDGAASRCKYRIRWYGSTLGPVTAPVLEVKAKKNLVGTKASFPLPTFNLDQDFTADSLRSIFSKAQLPALTRLTLREYNPVLLNGYRRKYFVSFDKKFRLTVDDKMHYRAIKGSGNFYLGKAIDAESVIVELKYGLDDTEEYNTIANYLNVRMTKSSKYVSGIFDIYG
jgi:hypothetical protein